MADYACANPPYDFRSLLVRIIGATGTFLPARGSVTGDGILARSGTVPAKAMRCNARVALSCRQPWRGTNGFMRT